MHYYIIIIIFFFYAYYCKLNLSRCCAEPMCDVLIYVLKAWTQKRDSFAKTGQLTLTTALPSSDTS